MWYAQVDFGVFGVSWFFVQFHLEASACLVCQATNAGMIILNAEAACVCAWPHTMPSTIYVVMSGKHKQAQSSSPFVLLVPKLELRAPCSAPSQCADANAICDQGFCSCSPRFYANKGVCGKRCILKKNPKKF
jgi:hypothetical protein